MKAQASELGTILRVYAGRKLPALHIDVRKFVGVAPTGPGYGDMVTVEGAGTSCEGRVVGFIAVVELDPETEPTVSPEQGTLA